MRETDDIDQIDVVLDILYNPETEEYTILEKSEWHQNNRGRFNPDEGGYPHEVPGGGIEKEPPYSEADLEKEGRREILEELNLEREDIEFAGLSGFPEERFDYEDVEHAEGQVKVDGGTLKKIQDGVFHTFYAVMFETDQESIEAVSDEHEGAEAVEVQEYYRKMGFNEIWALRQFMDPFQ